MPSKSRPASGLLFHAHGHYTPTYMQTPGLVPVLHSPFGAERLPRDCGVLRAREQDILLVPGDHFERPHHLRLGYGNEPSELSEALV